MCLRRVERRHVVWHGSMLQLFSVSDSLLLHVVPCCLILHLNTLAEVFYILIGCWFVHVKIMV